MTNIILREEVKKEYGHMYELTLTFLPIYSVKVKYGKIDELQEKIKKIILNYLKLEYLLCYSIEYHKNRLGTDIDVCKPHIHCAIYLKEELTMEEGMFIQSEFKDYGRSTLTYVVDKQSWLDYIRKDVLKNNQRFNYDHYMEIESKKLIKKTRTQKIQRRVRGPIETIEEDYLSEEDDLN